MFVCCCVIQYVTDGMLSPCWSAGDRVGLQVYLRCQHVRPAVHLCDPVRVSDITSNIQLSSTDRKWPHRSVYSLTHRVYLTCLLNVVQFLIFRCILAVFISRQPLVPSFSTQCENLFLRLLKLAYLVFITFGCMVMQFKCRLIWRVCTELSHNSNETLTKMNVQRDIQLIQLVVKWVFD